MKVLLTILLTTLCFIASAQCGLKVFSDTGSPLPFAHVAFKANPESKFDYVITDETGLALFPDSLCKQGISIKYKVSFMGFLSNEGSLNSQDILKIDLKPDEVILNQVVVTAQFAENSPEKAIQKVEIVDRKQIDLLGAQNLKEVLQHQSNIQISQDQALGSVLSLQGLSGENVKILIDGVPVIGRLNGNIDLSQINLDQIERIEIIEGPLSVSYGTDALAGTINLISKTPALSKKYALGANSYYETAGQYNLGLSGSISKKPHSLQLAASRNYFDGWNNTDAFIKLPKAHKADSSRFNNWKPKEQLQAKLSYRYDNGKMTIGAYADGFVETIKNKGYPRAPYQITAFDDIYRTVRRNLGLIYSHKLKKDYQVSSTFALNFYERTKNTYLRDLVSLQVALSENAGDQDTNQSIQFNSRTTFSTSSPFRTWNYQVGYEVKFETAEGLRISDATPMLDAAVFGSVQLSIKEKIELRPGLRIAYNNQYKGPLIPSINALVGKKNLKLRLSYAKGFRAPGLKELYFNFVDINHNIIGNSQLKAEQSNSFNAHLKWQKQIGIHLVKTEFSSYYNSLRDLIDLAQIPGSNQFQYTNIGKAQTTGASLKAEYAIAHLKASVSLAENGRKVELSENGTDAFFFSPQLRTSILFDFFQYNTSLAFFYTYNGTSSSLILDEFGETSLNEIGSYKLFDITLNKSFKDKQLKTSLGVKNLFNVQDVNTSLAGGTHTSGSQLNIAWGRSLFIKLSYNLNK